jgi:hypothetical protein
MYGFKKDVLFCYAPMSLQHACLQSDSILGLEKNTKKRCPECMKCGWTKEGKVNRISYTTLVIEIPTTDRE